MENVRLHLTLILDFADAIRLKVISFEALDALVQNNGDWILQCNGSNLNRSLGVQYLLRLIDKCKGMISKVGRYPCDARDFIHNFLFNAPMNRNFRALHYQEQPQSIRVNSSWVLEAKCFGMFWGQSLQTNQLRRWPHVAELLAGWLAGLQRLILWPSYSINRCHYSYSNEPLLVAYNTWLRWHRSILISTAQTNCAPTSYATAS